MLKSEMEWVKTTAKEIAHKEVSEAVSVLRKEIYARLKHEISGLAAPMPTSKHIDSPATKASKREEK